MKLYTFYRSSASYRVRIALNLKGLNVEQQAVHLRRGEQREDDYVSLNPQALVPTLVDDELTIGQSLAIISHLDETHPEPPLLPPDAAGRARVRQLALAIACEIHPLNNPKVLNYLTGEFGLGEEQRLTWYRHWIAQGMAAVESMLEPASSNDFCHGDAPTLADICLVPQIYNAERFDCDLSQYPNAMRITAACLALDPFARAAPDVQPDAE